MITIFTDGAARGNPGPGGWGAIIADEETVRELGGAENPTTNNRMELTAAISALEVLPEGSDAVCITDSAYVLNGITRWVKGWEKNNWKNSHKEDVVNRDLWEKLISATARKTIDWQLVKGHAGLPANERCDTIATAFADGKNIVLYRGARSRYGVDLTAKIFSMGESKDKQSKSKTKAYSYVSAVNGIVMVHKTWEECKARVHGVSSARYKKAVSPEDEADIIREFSNFKSK